MRPTVLGLSQCADPLDHVIGRELLEHGPMTRDYLCQRLPIAVDRQGQSSLSFAPSLQGGLDCESSRDVGLLSGRTPGRTTVDRCRVAPRA